MTEADLGPTPSHVQIREDDAAPWRILVERLETVGQPNHPVRAEHAAWTLGKGDPRPGRRAGATAHRHGSGAWTSRSPTTSKPTSCPTLSLLGGGITANLWPVTGPGHPHAQRSLALAVARRREDGLGLRVRLPGAWNDSTTSEVLDLLDRLPSRYPVDLLPDLGTVLPDRPDAAKEGLRALDALVPLTSWRTVTVMAGGFPDPPSDFREGVPYEAPRSDWETWEEIQHSDRRYLP